MNEEEKKAIKIINDYIERKRATRTVYNTEDIIFDNIIILLGLLEKQEEIEKRYKNNYIPKQKIRDILNYLNDTDLNNYELVMAFRKMMKELLEENDGDHIPRID